MIKFIAFAAFALPSQHLRRPCHAYRFISQTALSTEAVTARWRCPWLWRV